ncbi:MAG: gluconokinase [Synergistetes bacterium]|nr:gluconokinase [Synergistota bacterium]
MSLVLVVDVGTTNIKAGVVNQEGSLLSSAEMENRIHSPELGASEHDPEELFKSIVEVSRKAVGGFSSEVEFMVLSSYQLGLLPVNEHKRPLMGIMTLLDTRAQMSFDELIKGVDTDELYRRTGCPPSYLYPFAKLLWMRNYKVDVFGKASYFLGSKDYLIYRLTGRLATEPSISSATQMFNIHKRDWDDYALSLLSVDRGMLPEVVGGNTVIGEVFSDVKEEIGVKGKLYLLPGVYDGGGLVVGLGGFQRGIGSVNLGTTSMLRVAVDTPVLDRYKRLQTYHFFSDTWLTGEGINNAGVVLRWFRNNLVDLGYDELTSMASRVRAGADGLVFLPYFTGERDCRIGGSSSGVLFGLREYHTAAHIVRAILEGVGYTIRMVKDAIQDNGIAVEEIRVGGSGAKSDLWLRIISNVTGVPVKRSKCGYVSFVGEAMLGYVAMGFYKDIQEASSSMVKLGEELLPGEDAELYNERYEAFSYLVSCMKDVHERYFDRGGEGTK